MPTILVVDDSPVDRLLAGGLLEMNGDWAISYSVDGTEALEKLHQAYDRGFRELWMVDIDGRLDAVRGLPAFADFKARIIDDIDQCLAAIRNARVASL